MALLGLMPLAQAAFQTQAAYQSVTVVSNGDPANRINVVFLGEGYKDSEQTKFLNDVTQVIQSLFDEDPLKEYQSYFNVYAVEVTSKDSGVGHPAQGIMRDTAFNMKYDFGGLPGCIGTKNPTLVVETARNNVPVIAHVLFVLVNDPVQGGCSDRNYVVAAMSSDGAGPALAAAGFGHNFAVLADEGNHGLGSYPSALGEPAVFNVTTQTVRNQIKWDDWMNPATPIPTTCPSTAVGLFEGAMGYEHGVYRSTCTSKMRTSGW